jgi:hypothetical protein
LNYFHDVDSLVNPVVKAIRQKFSVPRYPDIDKLLPSLFEGGSLLEEHFRVITKKKLYPMVTRTDFTPELIVGINEGGTLAAAVLTQQYESVPMGIIHTQKHSFTEKKDIAYFSLPQRVGQTGAGCLTMDIKVNRILVVDAKFKSGSSVLAVDFPLREKYGEKCDIRYGIILAYGGLDPARLKPVRPGQPWYVQLPGINATGYVASYTNIDPMMGIDPIMEEVRH